MKIINVVSAIIKKENKVLVAKRSYGELKDYWEFPGGKIDDNESAKEALIREIKEELNANLSIGKHFATIKHTYPNFKINMQCYICSIDKFSINKNIHSEIKWLKKEELDYIKWLPADIKIINKLKVHLSQNILISACLMGDNCKYNGKNNYNQNVIDLVKDKNVIKICPEILTKLKIPRKPVEILNDRIITKDNEDMTYIYNQGVNIAMQKIATKNIDIAILKANSPTCGNNKIYDGSFKHKLIKGNGIFCKKLKAKNIMVISEQDLSIE